TRSSANSAHGQRQNTLECGNSSQGTIVNEKANEIAPNSAEAGDRSISVNQSQKPISATTSLNAVAQVNAIARGRRSATKVKGESAAAWPLAASPMPQPFQRLRQGSDLSSKASRTALAQGAICVATSLRSALRGATAGAVAQGGKMRTWSTG